MPPPEEVSSANEGAGGEAVDGGIPPPVDGGTSPPVDGFPSTDAAEKEEGRETEKWFIEMRGWIMVVAVQVAAFTYQAGLSPPDRFKIDPASPPSPTKPHPLSSPISGEAESTDETFRCMVFFYSNTTAFLTSLAIIILLMNRSFYGSLVRVTVLEIIVVLDMIGLMAAYWAGSTQKYQTNMFALLLTALVLFVIYVVYAVQLFHKLWALLLSAVRRREPVPARAATLDDGGATPVPNQQDIGDTRAPPPLDLDVVVVGRYNSELRRRDSRLSPVGTDTRNRAVN